MHRLREAIHVAKWTRLYMAEGRSLRTAVWLAQHTITPAGRP